jgi:hypothetical protein
VLNYVSAMPEKPASTSPAPARFDWSALAQYKAGERFLDGYPSDIRTFYSPVDKVHAVLVSLLASTQKSIVLNMFGYDDGDLNDIIWPSSKMNMCTCR